VQVSFRKVLLGSLIAATFAMPAAADLKVGVVDIAKLFEESPQAKVVQDGLKAEFGPRLQQLIAQEQALKTRNDKYQKDLATMAADQRTKAEKDLRDSARELERKKAELQDDSNAKRQEEMNKLQRLLFGEVRDYAKAQNFDIVIAEGVLYATPTVDITAAVLSGLVSRAPKPAAGAPAATPAKPPAKP
jgi:outer membrane protein